jgi:hypothetical protein
MERQHRRGIIRLKTNSAHLNDFWLENWYPAQLEADLEPHGVLYAVDGIAGREARGFYNAETRTGVLVNTDNYGPLRSLALGLVMDHAERMFGARCGDVGRRRGNGSFSSDRRTNKTSFSSSSSGPAVRIQSNDVVFVATRAARRRRGVERKLYMPTNTVEAFDRPARSSTGAVRERRDAQEDCRDEECPAATIAADRGSPTVTRPPRKRTPCSTPPGSAGRRPWRAGRTSSGSSS